MEKCGGGGWLVWVMTEKCRGGEDEDVRVTEMSVRGWK